MLKTDGICSSPPVSHPDSGKLSLRRSCLWLLLLMHLATAAAKLLLLYLQSYQIWQADLACIMIFPSWRCAWPGFGFGTIQGCRAGEGWLWQLSFGNLFFLSSRSHAQVSGWEIMFLRLGLRDPLELLLL